jgi:hypothetical protein
MNYKIISAILVMALAVMACGFSIDLPQGTEPGPEVTDQITVAAPATEGPHLSIAFGAGELKLAPGAVGNLVEGSATYNITDLKPEIKQDGSNIQIKQGDYQFDNVITANKIKNNWDLKLADIPMDLTIEAGAYKGTMELGGLALNSLTIKDGAADTEVSFSAPNKSEMSVLQYETGASKVKLSGLANANFNTMIFKAGAGEYDLDFSGELQKNVTISISSGLSNLTLRIPQGANAVVTAEGGLRNISTSSSWSQSGNTYTQQGGGPTLTFVVEMSAGNLTLTD